MQMSELDAYQAGGTIHIVINNQVGFTTNYTDGRSSIYCTDVAKVTQSPVFHVNGDDVEAVVHAVKLAMEFRQKFHKDVFIDLLCYRRHGHNEGDEPRFTQPTLYKLIEKHKNPREIYFEKLLAEGSVEANLAKEMDKNFRKFLQERLDNVKQNPVGSHYSFFQSMWKELRPGAQTDWEQPSPETGVADKVLRPLAVKMLDLPAELSFIDKTVKINENRKAMLQPGGRLDWSMGELLAYASLLAEGHPVRMTGQDVERGTFAHRHAVLVVQDTETEHIPLNHLTNDQAKIYIQNSLLSEYAVLGFEFGYSWSAPQSLCIWEAQFGDFANGAQIIIDQYIACSFTKWNRMSGMVMLLPHGYEGQGPEHSSARLERFLELWAGNNIQVCNVTTPANFFHLLRRQIKRPFRVPLVVMSPKNLLRLPEATSSFDELTTGRFQEVIDDVTVNAAAVTKVLICTGKIYYELIARRTADNRNDVAIIRMEQIAPLPMYALRPLFEKYKNAAWTWVQEEPENMGAWPFLCRKLREIELTVASRRESASPATGYKKQHDIEQKDLVDIAFGEPKENQKKNKVLINK
jgi:2-oxoglutarate dehydrogenase E1 component